MGVLDHILWWTGVIVWVIGLGIGVSEITNIGIDRLLWSLRLKREFLTFCHERFKARYGKDHING